LKASEPIRTWLTTPAEQSSYTAAASRMDVSKATMSWRISDWNAPHRRNDPDHNARHFMPASLGQ